MKQINRSLALAGLFLLLGIGFNNCNKVNVSEKTQESVDSQGAVPTDLATTCENAKALGQLKVAHLKASFPDPGKVCNWGVDGNLSIRDGYVRARTEQSQSIQVPEANSLICNIQMTSTAVSRFYYDDNVILTLNGYVLASTTDFSRHFQAKNGYYQYDWSRLTDQPAQNTGSDSTLDKQYCAGAHEGLSSCQFPQTETTGTAQLQIGEKVIQSILSMTDARQFHLDMITTGDNDSTDCQHVPIDLNLDVEYVVQ